jgi:hypothetical protein
MKGQRKAATANARSKMRSQITLTRLVNSHAEATPPTHTTRPTNCPKSTAQRIVPNMTKPANPKNAAPTTPRIVGLAAGRLTSDSDEVFRDSAINKGASGRQRLMLTEDEERVKASTCIHEGAQQTRQ